MLPQQATTSQYRQIKIHLILKKKLQAQAEFVSESQKISLLIKLKKQSILFRTIRLLQQKKMLQKVDLL